jgi:tRNA(Arg) A34 adenosine deaminase TadA
MLAPEVALTSVRYFPDGSFCPIEPFVTEAEQRAMDMCLTLGEEALHAGNPPVGAVLLDNERGLLWGARTTDETNGHILGHAELRVYDKASATIGRDMSHCSLVTTAQPCTTCTPPYAEGKIGRIIFAAPRESVLAVAGIMRQRSINMPDLLADGETNTDVVSGYQAAEALSLFGLYRERRNAMGIARREAKALVSHGR